MLVIENVSVDTFLCLCILRLWWDHIFSLAIGSCRHLVSKPIIPMWTPLHPLKNSKRNLVHVLVESQSTADTRQPLVIDLQSITVLEVVGGWWTWLSGSTQGLSISNWILKEISSLLLHQYTKQEKKRTEEKTGRMCNTTDVGDRS